MFGIDCFLQHCCFKLSPPLFDVEVCITLNLFKMLLKLLLLLTLAVLELLLVKLVGLDAATSAFSNSLVF